MFNARVIGKNKSVFARIMALILRATLFEDLNPCSPAGAFIGLDSPLTVTQMLWVNLIWIHSQPHPRHRRRFRNPSKVKGSFGRGFVWIALVIVQGQILIVTLAGPAFNVSRLDFADWLWIILLTSPVFVVADVVRTVMVVRKK